MSLKNNLLTLISGNASISAVVGTRVYCDEAGQNTTFPYVVIQETESDYLGDLKETTGLQKSDVRIICCAERSVKSDELSKLVHSLLKDYTGTVGASVVKSVDIMNNTHIQEQPDDGSQVYVHANIINATIFHIQS